MNFQSDDKLSWRQLALLAAFALTVRLAHVLAMASSPYFAHPVVDAATYETIGRSIAAGHGYPESVFWHPPGYPVFLGLLWALAGPSYLLPRLLQVAMGAANVVLVAWMGARCFGRKVGLASGIVAALYGMLIYFDGELLAPSLSLLGILGAVCLATLARERDRWWPWLLSGVVGGLAGVVVATTLLVPAVIAGFARRRAGWVLLGTALALAPVTARNWFRGHELVLVSSNGGVNFWIGNNPDYDQTVAIRPDLGWQRLVEEPRRLGIAGDESASRYFARKAWAWAAADPWAFLRLQAHKLRLLVAGNELYRNHAIYPARMESPILRALLWKVPGLAFPFGLLLPLGAIGLVVGARRAPLLVVLVLGLAATVLAFFVAARYRMVLVPFLIVFAVEAVRWFANERRRAPRAAAGIAFVVLFLVANLGQGAMDSRMNPDAEYALAMRLGEQGRMDEARALFESAVAARPTYAEAWLNLSVCYDAAGRVQDARAAFARAFTLDRSATLRMLRQFAKDGNQEISRRLLDHLREHVGAPTVSPE